MAYNILIVDDSSVVRKVLIKTFSITGIPVNTFYQAENGSEALDVLRNNWVDIVFLDINMPVMNGMEFMQRFTKEERWRGTPVIVVSTEGSKERQEELLRAGVAAYLRKPATPESLVEVIERVLGEAKNA